MPQTIKITKPQDLYDHTIHHEFDERKEVLDYLDKNGIGYKIWNNGLIIVKKQNDKFLTDEITTLGYNLLWWHKDIKAFVNVQNLKHLTKLYKTHQKVATRAIDAMEELKKLKLA